MLLDIKGYSNEGLDVTDPEGTSRPATPTMDTHNGNSDLPNHNGNRPLFKIAPPTSDGAYAIQGDGNGNPTDLVIGLHGSNSTPKLQINGMRSRDSRESLIPEEDSEQWWHIATQVCIPLLGKKKMDYFRAVKVLNGD